MRWFNHILISAAPAALIAPNLAPYVILGATAPDWLEWVSAILRQPVQHRGPTHWVLAWAVGILVGILIPNWAGSIVTAFAWGGLSHCLADSLTITGVPFSPLSDRRFHLMGGQLRTGGAGEYGVSWSVVLICWVLSSQFSEPRGNYIPFFFNWSQRYQDGIATAKEWRDNRLKFF